MLRIASCVDVVSDKDHYLIVSRWLSLLLLFGAMVVLWAHEVAFASAPAMSSAAVTASQMSDGCAEMMKAATSQGDKPCKGLTLDCIAKMGCSIPSAVISMALPLAEQSHSPGLLDPLRIRRLHGRTLGPEPDPPLLPAC